MYAKPDELKQGRVLAALTKGGTLFIPVRSMFEAMGASVKWDEASHTMDITKPGTEVQLTVGKSKVLLNGESRPLDVPPEIYQGVVVAPIRVIDGRVCIVGGGQKDRRRPVSHAAGPNARSDAGRNACSTRTGTGSDAYSTTQTGGPLRKVH